MSTPELKPETALTLADKIEARATNVHAQPFDDLIEENWKIIVEALRHRAAATNALSAPAQRSAAAANSDEDWNIRKYIDFLRADEGDSVTLLCDNPDPRDDSENNAVECNGYWTNFQDRRFAGRTLEAALELAYFECRQWRENPPPDVSPDPLHRDGQRAVPPHDSALIDGLKAAIRAVKLALFVIRKQDVMPNSSWQSGFDKDLATAESALAGHSQEENATLDEIRGSYLHGRAEAIEECANLALAIDSGRGNEKEIAKAISALDLRAKR